MITFVKTAIIVVLMVMFGIAIGNLLTSCASYKYDDCTYERTVEKTMTCEGGKEGGTVLMPGGR